MGSRKPEAHLVDETGWVVHGTWDIELATALVKHADTDVCELPPPVRTWLRMRPASPSERACNGYRAYYCTPRAPGERGAFKAVEFPEPMFTGQKTVYPMGIRAKDAALAPDCVQTLSSGAEATDNPATLHPLIAEDLDHQTREMEQARAQASVSGQAYLLAAPALGLDHPAGRGEGEK